MGMRRELGGAGSDRSALRYTLLLGTLLLAVACSPQARLGWKNASEESWLKNCESGAPFYGASRSSSQCRCILDRLEVKVAPSQADRIWHEMPIEDAVVVNAFGDAVNQCPNSTPNPG
jgi:hypothetical protein